MKFVQFHAITESPVSIVEATGSSHTICTSRLVESGGHDGAWMAALDPDNLRLTDFMDLPTLQEIQDSFAAVANVKATITDADGKLLTQPTPTREFLRRQSALAADEENQPLPDSGPAEGPQREGAEYVAPIMVNNQRLGTIRMTAVGAL